MERSQITPRTLETEKDNPVSGWVGVFVVLSMLAMGVFFLLSLNVIFTVLGTFTIILTLFFTKGLFTLEPNESAVLIFFGNYDSTVRKDAFFWVNPFFKKERVSLRVQNFNTPALKVNDKMGNPIEIAAVITWHVSDTAQAVFDVEDYERYIHVQSEMALREVASAHAYDGGHDEISITLRGNFQAVSKILNETVQDHVEIAGIKIVEAKITHLAYAPEIASVMLRRQQAEAVVQAREKMVEGAIGMVKLALNRMESESIAQFTPHERATLITNMMTVLLSETGAQPVIQMAQAAE
jgi:regulator of protease activity HflC (stomatin/prohibitin superfamily)